MQSYNLSFDKKCTCILAELVVLFQCVSSVNVLAESEYEGAEQANSLRLRF